MYPKCHFMFLINWKNEIQKFILKFCFYHNMKNEIQIIDYYFHVKIDLCFEFLMLSFVFHFHKKWKTKYSPFFIFHFHEGLLLNSSRLALWLFSQVWSTRYSKASSCQVPWDFTLCNGHASTKNPLFIHKFFKNHKIWFEI